MTASPEPFLAPLAEALRDRYSIKGEIGRGGMARVYLARDRRHERDVAIKVLDPELSSMLGSERFLREIWVTAQLIHPNVIPLLDSGQAGDLLYYVTPFAPGETLRARLVRAWSWDHTPRCERDRPLENLVPAGSYAGDSW